MAKVMKAAVVHQFGKPLVIEDVPVPVPGLGELLVKVMACGVCHTDLHAAAIAFAVEGKVKAEITRAPLSDINKIFANLKAGKVEGRIVLDLTAPIAASSKRTEAAHA